MKKTQRKDQKGLGKSLNTKIMFHKKKQRATKIVESRICSEWLEASLNANRDEKYTTLYRKDNSSVKRHKGNWHMAYFENSEIKK